MWHSNCAPVPRLHCKPWGAGTATGNSALPFPDPVHSPLELRDYLPVGPAGDGCWG